MYHLDQVYGKDTHDEFHRYVQKNRSSPKDLGPTQRSWEHVAKGPFWDVQSYEELIEKVSFLAAMNKRLVLYFRGQTADFGAPVLPQLFREHWYSFDQGSKFTINTPAYWDYLHVLGEKVKEICLKKGVDGFLIGRFPFYSPGSHEREKSDLSLRLIAKFRLNAKNGTFWNPNFPKISNEALYPDDQDHLFKTFVEEFGKEGKSPVYKKALELSRPLQSAASSS